MLFILIILSKIGHTQERKISINSLSVSEGLSNNQVNTVYQDKQGFLYIGTNGGLDRYDGNNFITYNVFNTPSMSNQGITGVLQDHDGTLWICTYNGLNMLDKQGNIIKVYRPDPKNPYSLSDHRIRSIYQGSDSTIWISTDNGTIDQYLGNDQFQTIYRWESEEDKLIYGDNTKYNPIFYMAEDSIGNLWTSDNSGSILRLEKPTNTLNTDPESLWNSTAMTSLKAIGVDSLHGIWGLNDQGLVRYNYAENKFIQHKDIVSMDNVRKGIMHQTNDGVFWLVDDADVCAEIDPLTGTFTNYFEQLADKYPSLNIKNTIIKDAAGSIWVATFNGLLQLSPGYHTFTTIPTISSGSSELYNVFGIAEGPQGNIFAYAENHLIQIDSQTSEIDTLIRIEGICNELLVDDSWIWGVNNELGIYKVHKKKKTLTRYKLPFKTRFHTILKVSSDEFWVGIGAGLFSFDSQNEQFTRIDVAPFLRNSRVHKIFQSSNGVIWVASANGLLKMNANKELLKYYRAENNRKDGLLYNGFQTIYEDSTGIMWIGSNAGGLIRFNPEKEKFIHYTQQDGLANNTVLGITEHSGFLWISTYHGLSRFNPINETFKNYFINDGLPYNTFNINSVLKSKDGKIYFGGLKGITTFSVKKLIQYQQKIDQNYNIPVLLTRLTKLDGSKNQLVDLTNIAQWQKEIDLNHYDRDITLNFSLADFNQVATHEYAYILEGIDKGWHQLGNQNRISFPSLPFGNYTLRIKAKTVQGTWSEQQLIISMNMNRIFYKKPAFIVAFTLGAFVIVYLFFRLRIERLRHAKDKLERVVIERTSEISQQKDKIETDKNTIEKQAKKLQKFNETQSRWFINIAHELRTPLTLILGPIRQFLSTPSEKTKTGIDGIQLAEKNGTQLLHLVNQMLDISRLESNELKLKKTSVDLTQLIRESVSNFDTTAWQKEITLTTDIHTDCHAIIDKERIRNILVNLISNALKFTPRGGEIVVMLTHKSNDQVSISVKDTGNGIPEKDLPHIFERYYQAADPDEMNQGGMGIGLALSLELARLHGGDIVAESQVGEGSIFTLLLTGVPANTTKNIDWGKMGKTNIVPSKPIRKPSTIPKEGQDKKPIILLVDDNADMRQYILSFMEAAYTILEAADGIEALEVLEKQSVDLILSDVMMPRMDGFQLLEKVKTQPHTCDTSIIMLTARAAQEDRLHALTIGVDDYLTKPFDTQELMARIRYILRNQLKKQHWVAKLPEQEKETLSPDAQFLTQAESVVMAAIDNHHYSVMDMAEDLHLSQRQLFRKIKSATGLSPLQFIREIRLQKARMLLENRTKETVAEVMYAVGFQKSDYFAQVYRKRFGKLPSEYFASA